ncbi:uncharacterized protein LOC106350018 [Brassica napus]|uniref:uncharacterized protein LOC106350018 n=1 Tax=Brassica napus TaxID=3708 RepID=UPI002078D0B7|nr:uncharacterized protein LOC106350018 [Brassica napus]
MISLNFGVCESLLKEEAAKFEQLHHKFMKEKADHLQGLKDTVSKFEEGKERLYMRYEQQRKKEKTMISEQERFCTEKIAQLEESLNKKETGKQIALPYSCYITFILLYD